MISGSLFFLSAQSKAYFSFNARNTTAICKLLRAFVQNQGQSKGAVMINWILSFDRGTALQKVDLYTTITQQWPYKTTTTTLQI